MSADDVAAQRRRGRLTSWLPDERWPGQFAAFGGAAWWVALAALAATGDVEAIVVRVLFGVSGVLAGLGLWKLAPLFPARSARVGCRIASGAAFAVGLGLAIGTFVGFILGYFGILFVTPAAFAVLAVGLLRSNGIPGWVKAIPWMLAISGIVLYGFHAVARDLWDPHDAFWLGILGGGWFLLGLAGHSISTNQRC